MNAESRGEDRKIAAQVNELSGTVHGPAVQARDVHGDIHLHHATTPLPKPNQLPATGVLVGRTTALSRLDAIRTRLEENGVPAVAVVSGPAGVGKSAVALHWAHRERAAFPDGRLFADLQGHAADDPVHPAEVLGRFIRAFGIAPERIPGGLAERSALYQSLVSERRLLVVLDDAVSAAQVSPLLPASAGSVAVVTSRLRLGGLLARGAQAVRLDRLGADAALELLEKTVGDDRVRAQPGAARELVKLCAGLPLALCVAAARLATRPNRPLTDMVEALTNERQRLSALSVEDDMTIRAALMLSYEGLAPSEAARVYRLLGLFPGTPIDARAAAAMANLPRAEVRRLLDVLLDANLLDDAPGGAVRLHELTRLHAREMAEEHDTEADRAEAVRRVLDWYLDTAAAASRTVMPYRRVAYDAIVHVPAEPVAFDGSAAALDWLERELPNLRTAVRTANERGLFPTAWQLVEALWPLFLYRGLHAERLEIDQMGLAAARDGANPRAEAKMLNRTGLALRALGRLDEAAVHFRGAVDIWRREGDAQRIAGGHRRLGLVELDRGRVAEAVALFEEALDGYRRTGEQRRAARTLADLGDALTRQGRTREAVARLTEARRLLAPEPDPYNQARVLILLGRARAGEPEAAGLLEEGLSEMRRIGSDAGEALALEALGDLAARERRLEDARAHYEEALRLLSARGADVGPVKERLVRLGES
ncbi:NTPase [Sphaerisporangium krabiense]|uniref:Tetratricopeptide (TPR) repeat protein n=1 Tax=Sphaerisporangium krabiense TaxID=763782 RepID=A0A7W8Z3W5_9ACTN|nr:tetratricopeptide repeat protein [Sphaerisporangium krabiense]MBB5626912.1 tetratricopeptide (TPR) repeat protein [Sphaerisporangium krabiense]GII66712.1 NTPase [Sphaerisporangium krabiense]